MKKLLTFLLALVLCVPVLTFAEEGAWQPLPDAGHVPGFDLVAQSDVLELYAKAETGEIAVYDKRNGRTTWSNPQDVKQDRVARNNWTRDQMKSQFYLEYIKANGVSGSFRSYPDCVDYDQMAAWTIPSGVAFTYEVGRAETVFLVPHCLSDARFQELYQGVEASVQRMMHGRANSIYKIHDDGNWYVSENGQKMSMRNLKMMSDAFAALGMTEDEYWYWQGLAGIQRIDPEQFVLVMEWTLEHDAVTCRIPADCIQERNGLTLTRISVAPWLGAVKDMTSMCYQVETYKGVANVDMKEQWSYALRGSYESYWKRNQEAGIEEYSYAVQSDAESALLMRVRKMPRYSQFKFQPAGRISSYGAMYYEMDMRVLYRFREEDAPSGYAPEIPVVYTGDLYDVIVRYQFLNEPCLLSEAE